MTARGFVTLKESLVHIVRGLNVTIDERIRKFLFMRGSPVGVEFSDREVREYVRIFLDEVRNERGRERLIEDLLFMVIEHLAEKEG